MAELQTGRYNSRKKSEVTMMPELTDDEQQAVQNGGDVPVRLTDPKTGHEYVLVRADIYDRLRAIVDSATKRANWDDPALDEYEAYRKRS